MPAGEGPGCGGTRGSLVTLSRATDRDAELLLLGGRLLPLTAALLLVEGTAAELAAQWAEVRQSAMAPQGYDMTF